MWIIALRSLTFQQRRLVVTIMSLGLLFLLSLIQVGLLVGWCLTTSEIIWRADAHLWVMAPQTPSLDYAASIPSRRIHQARSVPGVDWAEGMIVKWALWKRPDGRLTSVEVVGIDRDAVGGPWTMREGIASDVWAPDSVIVDAAYLDDLGVTGRGDEVDLSGSRAVIRGISQGVRTFTASPFVFASLNSSRRFVHEMTDEDITFVLVRCTNGIAPADVAKRIANEIPQVEVLTKHDFARRTATYWMMRTGAGATVLVVAVLGFTVSILVVSQALGALTMDMLPHYGVLRAMGFDGRKLAGVVVCQSAVLAAIGMSWGGLLFLVAQKSVSQTSLSLAMPIAVLIFLAATYLICCLIASVMPIRAILRVDPAFSFRV